MQDFEKLGAFYLGKRYDPDAGALTEELVLYDSADLTTHAVIIGMTGSGKTGLGVGLIEEAAMDRVPVIAIDPKGDLGNLLLTFPKLSAAEFEPWVDPRAAAEAGQSPAEFARDRAALWRKGLAEWGQSPERIAKLRDAADFAIYTPGSSAGRPLSVLGEFSAPPAELRDDADLYRERIQGTATGLLTLLGMDVDPVNSREHILVSNILDDAWKNGRSLGLAALIAAVQTPPFARIGVMDLDTFYPPADRFALAMRINNLLAAPGFEAWISGPTLDAGRLLYTESGKPRVSVLSIAHLDDNERMFFVTMLLAEIIGWMRKQPGTSSLRALLYMDEIFGYMPPVANPPSKKLFLTLLKQARAYGLGLVLATQNPVDLDYKGLSNTGTWFIGRLQTERDKARVRDGLHGSDSGQHLDAAQLETILSGLGKRRFLLHNVHETTPVLMQTRWVMSYLAGPLTRDQVRLLAGPPEPDARPAKMAMPDETSGEPPLVPPGVRQVWLPDAAAARNQERLVWQPCLFAAGTLGYGNARLKIDEQRPFALCMPADAVTELIDWNEADDSDIAVADVADEAPGGDGYAPCPAPLLNKTNYTAWQKQLKRHLRAERTLTIFKSATFGESSRPGESEGEFRVRLQQIAKEKRDVEVAKLRKRYEGKVTTLENRLLRAQQVVEREAEQARGSKIDTAISFGTAVLGAMLGRKRISTTSASRVGTAVRKAGRMRKQSGDVRRAEETVGAVREQLAELEAKFDADVEALDDAWDAQAEELATVEVKPKASEVDIALLALAWRPVISRPA